MCVSHRIKASADWTSNIVGREPLTELSRDVFFSTITLRHLRGFGTPSFSLFMICWLGPDMFCFLRRTRSDWLVPVARKRPFSTTLRLVSSRSRMKRMRTTRGKESKYPPQAPSRVFGPISLQLLAQDLGPHTIPRVLSQHSLHVHEVEQYLR